MYHAAAEDVALVRLVGDRIAERAALLAVRHVGRYRYGRAQRIETIEFTCN